MRHEIARPITIEQDTRLRGIVAGNVRVRSGAHLDLDGGRVEGSLTIENGASVCVGAVVVGAIVNRGTCHVTGWGNFGHRDYERAVRAALYPERHRRAHDPPRRLPSATPAADRDLRASDAEREVVIARLREHMVAGRLDVSELEQRVGVALVARTRVELTGLERDLPGARSDHHPEGVMTPPAPAATRRRLRTALPRGRTRKVCRRGRSFAGGDPVHRRLSSLAGKTAGVLVLVTLLALPRILAGVEHDPVGLCEEVVTHPSAYGSKTQVEDRRDGWHTIDGRRVSCRSGEVVALDG